MAINNAHARRVGRRKRVLGDVQNLGGLEAIAFFLNRAEEGEQDPYHEAWRRAYRLVIDPLLRYPRVRSLLGEAGARRGFNSMSRESKVRLVITEKNEPTVESGGSDVGEVLVMMHRYLFPDQAWLRLKRCEHCQKWLVDHTPNRSKLVHGRCRAKQWNSRAFRQERKLARIRRGGRQRGGARPKTTTGVPRSALR